MLLLSGSVTHADPKREVPDYDGRGNPDAHEDPWPLWIPRVLLSPLYVVNEYGVRRPLGAFVRKAEREHWADTVESVFRFGKNERNLIVPTALFDFGLLPSVGAYYAGDGVFDTDNQLRIHVAGWGAKWINTTLVDRYSIDSSDVVQLRGEFRRAEDNLFFGLGPDATTDTQSRYGLERLETTVGYRRRLANESRFELQGGIHRISFVDGSCCGDPTLDERVADGQLMDPPGNGDPYTTTYGVVDVILDSRSPRPTPGSGAFLHVHGKPSFEVHDHRSWFEYSAILGGAVDLTGHQRILKMQLALAFIDSLHGGPIPFTEYPTLGGDLMAGFVPGWMTGTSTAAAQLAYTWPVWIGLDGQTRFSFGNAFGNHLDGLGPQNLRMSWDLGFRTSAVRDQGFEVLAGFGTETFEQGAAITSVRVTIGSERGF